MRTIVAPVWSFVLVLLTGLILYTILVKDHPTNFTAQGENQSFIETSTVTPTDTLTPVSSADWNTYTDFAYGFSIAYPPTMVMGKIPVTVTYIPLCNDFYINRDGYLLLCFSMPKDAYPYTTNTDFRGADLQIGILKLNEPDCMTFKDWSQYLDAVKIQPTRVTGTGFSSIERRTGGLGHTAFEVMNRTFHNNICFELKTMITITLFAEIRVWTGTPAIKPFTEERNIQAILDQMVSSFQFVPLEDN